MRGWKTAFIDLAFLLVLVFLMNIRPPQSEAKPDSEIESPGTVAFEIGWEGASDADVDLWVLGPCGLPPVGYSNHGNLCVNLVRDDLGQRSDPMPVNYENTFVRGDPAGKYAATVHLYRADFSLMPLSVEARISVRRKSGRYEQVLQKTVLLTGAGQEEPLWMFELDDDGQVVRQWTAPFKLRSTLNE